jgi:hypothetical protein
MYSVTLPALTTKDTFACIVFTLSAQTNKDVSENHLRAEIQAQCFLVNRKVAHESATEVLRLLTGEGWTERDEIERRRSVSDIEKMKVWVNEYRSPE